MHALQSVPNTIPYLIAGYAVIGTIGLVYIVSLIVRQRNLRRDVETLEMLTREDNS
jgi:CcmD family protein